MVRIGKIIFNLEIHIILKYLQSKKMIMNGGFIGNVA